MASVFDKALIRRMVYAIFGLQTITPTGADNTKYLRGDGAWVVPPSGSGVADGDKGDITVASGVWSIDTGVVSTTKLGGDITVAGKAILDDVDAAAQRTTLGAAASSHNHGASDITSGTIATARLGAGTASSSTYLRGDQTWATPSGGVGSTYTEFTKNLGESANSGVFDITGLSGLTTNKIVNVIQTASQISSRGDARDEPEMDMIILTGYVLNSTTIRVYWKAPSVVVGTYNFAYQVSA